MTTVTVATDEDLRELSRQIRADVIEAIDETLEEDRTRPCRVTVDVDAEEVAEPPEGGGSNVETEVGP